MEGGGRVRGVLSAAREMVQDRCRAGRVGGRWKLLGDKKVRRR